MSGFDLNGDKCRLLEERFNHRNFQRPIPNAQPLPTPNQIPIRCWPEALDLCGWGVDPNSANYQSNWKVNRTARGWTTDT